MKEENAERLKKWLSENQEAAVFYDRDVARYMDFEGGGSDFYLNDYDLKTVIIWTGSAQDSDSWRFLWCPELGRWLKTIWVAGQVAGQFASFKYEVPA